MSKPFNILFIDNFDSFSFNLVDEFRKRRAKVSVWRNDLEASRAVEIVTGLPSPSMIVLSPGPGRPRDAGCCLELVRLAQGVVPIFGVCLGHQVIVKALGGSIIQADQVVHGKAAPIEHDGRGIFERLPSPLWAGRYHSLVAGSIPAGLKVTAHTGDLVMAVEHERHPIASVQFHPESVLTPQGGQLIARIMAWAARYQDPDDA